MDAVFHSAAFRCNRNQGNRRNKRILKDFF
jgi:hypothetical protein